MTTDEKIKEIAYKVFDTAEEPYKSLLKDNFDIKFLKDRLSLLSREEVSLRDLVMRSFSWSAASTPDRAAYTGTGTMNAYNFWQSYYKSLLDTPLKIIDLKSAVIRDSKSLKERVFEIFDTEPDPYKTLLKHYYDNDYASKHLNGKIFDLSTCILCSFDWGIELDQFWDTYYKAIKNHAERPDIPPFLLNKYDDICGFSRFKYGDIEVTIKKYPLIDATSEFEKPEKELPKSVFDEEAYRENIFNKRMDIPTKKKKKVKSISV